MNTQKTNAFEFLKNKSVLFISEDQEISKIAKEGLENCLKNLSISTSILTCKNFYEFDLVVVDIDNIEVSQISSILAKDAKDLPVIFISSNINNSIVECTNEIKLRNVILKDKNCDFLKYYVAIVLKKTGIVNFNDGFYFDMDTDQMFCNNKEIKLTNLEIDLFKFLLKNRSQIVTYDQIEASVWEGRKYTIYGMRNVVNKIREKTYYDIISNMSKNGYIIKNYYIFS